MSLVFFSAQFLRSRAASYHPFLRLDHAIHALIVSIFVHACIVIPSFIRPFIHAFIHGDSWWHIENTYRENRICKWRIGGMGFRNHL